METQPTLYQSKEQWSVFFTGYRRPTESGMLAGNWIAYPYKDGEYDSSRLPMHVCASVFVEDMDNDEWKRINRDMAYSQMIHALSVYEQDHIPRFFGPSQGAQKRLAKREYLLGHIIRPRLGSKERYFGQY
jgi:hypothetical protein